ncbi:MAG: hypothetical protein GY714_05460 [Desulfobacterales bacterium]|nr:hypothetical protein [Desulfobacterales bacterium]
MALIRSFLKLVICSLVLIMLSACGAEDLEDNPGDGNSGNNNNIKTISGVIQKGPFLKDSTIWIYDLDSKFNRTAGFNYTKTTDNFGSFEISEKFDSEYIEIEVNYGKYFNEVSGNIVSNLKLRAISKITKNNKINVNILTTLSAKRIRFLINKGFSVKNAVIQSKKEILSIFNINSNEINNFDQMDISVDNDSNAVLLLISSILVGGDYGYDYENNYSYGGVSGFLEKLAEDLESDGVVNEEILKTKLRETSNSLDLQVIRTNVENRYRDLGAIVKIPKFENFIDSNGDGISDNHENTNNSRPQFDWSDSGIPNSGYDFQLANDPDFNDIVVDKSGLSVSNYTLTSSEHLPNAGDYYWRIAVINKNGVRGDWRKKHKFSFEMHNVSLYNPSGNVFSSRPYFDWSNSAYKDFYHFQLASDSDFNDILYKKENITSSNHTPEFTLQNLKPYYWRVAVIDKNGAQSNWSTPNRFLFDLGTVSLHTPSGNQYEVSKPTFKWSSGSNNSDRYHFQLASDPDFKYIKDENKNLSSSSYTTIFNLNHSTPYYFRVAIIDENNVKGNWSTYSECRFNIGTVSLEPSGGSGYDVQKPSFEWSDSSLSNVTYHFQLASDPDFKTILEEKNGLDSSEYTITQNLNHSTPYYWRVLVISENGIVGNWSEPLECSFNIGTVTLKPSGGTGYDVQKPTFEWSDSPLDKVTYHFQLTTDSEFNNIIEEKDGIESSLYTILQNLSHLTPYYFRVAVINEAGIRGDWSEPLECKVDLKLVSLISPAGYADSLQPAFNWSDSSLANVKYHFQLASDSSFTKILDENVGDLTSSNFKTSVTLTNSTQYYIRIATIDEYGKQGYWANFDFIVDLHSWATASAGLYYTFAVKKNGKLYAWGYNRFGQLGDGTEIDKDTPTQIGSDNDWSMVTAGRKHRLALKKDGRLYLWGERILSHLGDNSWVINIDKPYRLGDDSNWAMISAGSGHSLALKEDGRLYSFGENSDGQLGDDNRSGYLSQVGSDSDWASVSAGENHTIALKKNGTLYAWGANNNGQLGDGTNTKKNTPVQIGSGNDWAFVTAGGNHSVALKKDGTLYGWGSVGYNFGDGITEKNEPTQIGFDNNWNMITTSAGHTLAIKKDGTLYAWGFNRNGELGDGTGLGKNTITQIGSESDWVSVSAGGSHTIAIKKEGQLYAWGDNSWGQLGFPDSTPNEIKQIGSEDDWAMITAGYSHSLSIKKDGSLYAWGDNYYNQLGDDTSSHRSEPTQIYSENSWVSMVSGMYYTLAIKNDGTLHTWGGSSNSDKDVPTQIGLDSNWESVAVFENCKFAIKKDGILYAWGENGYGQLGDGTDQNKDIPTQIGSGNNWSMVTTGGSHTIAIKKDGRLYAWGSNHSGQLGNGTTFDRYAPIQIGPDKDWASAAAGRDHTIAIKKDGRLYAWGNNYIGQLGDGTNSDKDIPTQIGFDEDWVWVAAYGSNTYAIKDDGTLYRWAGNKSSRTRIPTQIGYDSDWASVNANGLHTIAMKTDGTIHSVGNNDFGQLGNGTTSNMYTPIMIEE